MKPEIKAALLKVAGTDESLIGEIDQLEERVDSVNRSTEDMIKRNVPAAPKAPAAKTAVKEPVAPPYRTPAPIARAAAPAPKAADRSEDIKALLGAPEFKVVLKDVMREVVSELMPAPAAAAANDDDDEKVEGGEEPTEEGTEETPADGAQATPADVVLAEIRALNKKVDGLTQDSKQRVADMLADLPSKIANEKVFRPRATRMPATLRQRDSMDLSAIAEETLAKIGDNE